MVPPQITNRKIAQIIQKASVEAAKDGFSEALIRGLCADGAMEAAISAIELLDIDKLLSESVLNYEK